nr:glyceraldehyde 3-phosphate dehydrogenase NAD-binding domain-containing protein [Endozoicomonas sp.]
MTIKVGINGFGRIGRLALRAAWHWPDIEFVRINDAAGDSATLAHLLEFDSVQGVWQETISSDNRHIIINGQTIECSQEKEISAIDWSNCDVVIDATGVHRATDKLNQYLEQGVKRVVVTAPVKEDSVLNIVMGVNDHLYDAVSYT